jgi:hypothetical protein
MELISYSDLIFRFMLNLGAMTALIFLLYYPRYKHKETAISAALFNIFAFAVLTVLSTVKFSIAAGFGLFAILALFTLRSEQINKSDIAYFFGSISIAVITSIVGTSLTFALVMILIVLISVFIIDHPRILRSVGQMKITLDHIPQSLLSKPEILRDELSKRLGVEILSYRITSICYVSEVIKAEVDFRPKEIH